MPYCRKDLQLDKISRIRNPLSCQRLSKDQDTAVLTRVRDAGCRGGGQARHLPHQPIDHLEGGHLAYP
jgi:hypothetical protein